VNRIAGLETEYGCLTTEQFGPASVIGRVRSWIFDKHRFGLADTHQRDWDEPAGNGGFLFNGGRAYVDMGHLEYCTPECVCLRDLLVYDRAGDAIVQQALKELRLAEHAGFVRNNVDHYSGATFGCHENYLVRRSAPLTEANVLSLLAFLTLRMLYTSAGRVGASLGAEFRGDTSAVSGDTGFQISQRADYINNDLFEWVQFNRAIINTRDEPLADPRRYRRLHLLHGDTNVLPTALALKMGTTALVLDLLEADRLPHLALADAVLSFRTLSHQPEGPWLVPLADGRQASPVEVLREFLEAAKTQFQGRDLETDDLLLLWEETLVALESDLDRLIGRVDWITKRWLFRQFLAREGLTWRDPWLKAQDLEYHHINPDRGLGLPLSNPPAIWQTTPHEIAHAMRSPPVNTRASLRTRIMHVLKVQPIRYYVDWDVIDAEGVPSLNLTNPFEASSPEAEAWTRLLAGP
jgi:proteasome accessory factor A